MHIQEVAWIYQQLHVSLKIQFRNFPPYQNEQQTTILLRENADDNIMKMYNTRFSTNHLRCEQLAFPLIVVQQQSFKGNLHNNTLYNSEFTIDDASLSGVGNLVNIVIDHINSILDSIITMLRSLLIRNLEPSQVAGGHLTSDDLVPCPARCLMRGNWIWTMTRVAWGHVWKILYRTMLDDEGFFHVREVIIDPKCNMLWGMCLFRVAFCNAFCNMKMQLWTFHFNMDSWGGFNTRLYVVLCIIWYFGRNDWSQMQHAMGNNT